MSLLLYEIKKFFKQNWWVLVLFFVSLISIWLTGAGSVLEVMLIFSLHFLADICIMIMADYLKQGDDDKALFFQTVSFLIFSSIGLYAGLVWGKWVYLLLQLMFIWPLIKVYVNKFGIRLRISETFLVGFGIIFIGIYLYFGLVKDFGGLFQLLGFVLFPIGLSLNSRRWQYWVSVIGIFFIFLGSAYQLVGDFLNYKVSGVDVSYTLLPMAVVAYYLKDFKNYLKADIK